MSDNRSKRKRNKIPEDIIEDRAGIRCWLFSTLFETSETGIDKKIGTYLKSYPKEGYSTTYRKSRLQTGVWCAQIRRFSSCE